MSETSQTSSDARDSDHAPVDPLVTQNCITCGEDGHTYINCPKAPFAAIVAGAFGLPDITGNRAQVRKKLEELSG